MKMNLRRFGALAVSLLALNACDLEVTNPNDPETERVLGTAQDVESLLGSYYRRWHSGLYNDDDFGLWPIAGIMSFENYSSLANFCMNARAPVPTAPVNANSVGNACDDDQNQPYFQMGEVARVASNVVSQIEGGLEFGSDAQKERNLAFAEFLRGLSLGYTALFYDSAAIIVAGQDPEDAGDLKGHGEVMDSALAAMQRAIDHANAAGTAAGGFPLPDTWIPSPTTFTQGEFVRLVRTYRARLRANVARTPAERAAVDWNAVILDSQNGITSDHFNTTDNDLGPYHDWVTYINPGGDTWHQMPPFIIGMGDVSGSYAAWINQPIGSRGAGNVSFFMVSPDQRFPQGATRAEQRADFAISSCESPGVKCKRYFVNRDASDQFSGLSWGWSNYDFERFHTWAEVGDAGSPTDGNIPFFTKVELDMLEAEGHIRQGNYVAAAALINKTRTAAPDPVTGAANGGGLPPVLALPPGTPATGAMPDCVPKTPVNASNGGGGTLVCGDIMEAMKWEKRLETLMTHFSAWFLDSRGWGDLAQGVPLFWATPYEDLLARNITNLYGTGAGVGTAPNSAAAVSGYGW